MAKKFIRHYFKAELAKALGVSKNSLKTECMMALESAIDNMEYRSHHKTLRYYIANWDYVKKLPPIVCTVTAIHIGIELK